MRIVPAQPADITWLTFRSYGILEVFSILRYVLRHFVNYGLHVRRGRRYDNQFFQRVESVIVILRVVLLFVDIRFDLRNQLRIRAVGPVR